MNNPETYFKPDEIVYSIFNASLIKSKIVRYIKRSDLFECAVIYGAVFATSDHDNTISIDHQVLFRTADEAIEKYLEPLREMLTAQKNALKIFENEEQEIKKKWPSDIKRAKQ